MLKKVFFIVFPILMIATIGLVFLRELIFPTSINLGFTNNYQNAVCKAIITKDKKQQTITKTCGYNFKFRTPYASKVKIIIDSPSAVNILTSRIGHNYPTVSEFNQFFNVNSNYQIIDNKIKIKAGHSVLEIKQPIPLQCEQLKIIFVSPLLFIFLSLGFNFLILAVLFFLIVLIKKSTIPHIRFNFTERSLIRGLKILSIMLFLVIIFFQIFKTMTCPLGYDDAYQASVSKNIAKGLGYATSYNGIKLFNPELTTGYPIVLPVALGMKIFSNKYWVPNLICSSIVLFLLLIVLYLPKKFDFIDEKKLWIWRTIFLGFLVFSCSLEPLMKYHLELSSFLGEMPSVLLIIIFTFVLIIAKNKKSTFILAGLLGGLAFATKFISIISVFPIFAAYLFLTCQNKNDFKEKIPHIAMFLIGFALPYIAFEIFKIVDLGGISQYLQMKAEEHEFFIANGSGISGNGNIFKRFSDNSKNLISLTGFIRFFIILLMPIIFTVKLLKNRKTIHPQSYFVYIFMFAFAVNLYWWLFMSLGWGRHLLIGWILFLTAISTFVFCFNNKNKYVYLVLIVLFLSLPCSFNVDSTFLNFKKLSETHSKIQDLNEAANFIKTHVEYKYYGCGWWVSRDLEYILPTVNNFSDAIDTKQFNKTIPNKALVINAHTWNWDENIINNNVKKQCSKKILFKNNNYIISLCD